MVPNQISTMACCWINTKCLQKCLNLVLQTKKCLCVLPHLTVFLLDVLPCCSFFFIFFSNSFLSLTQSVIFFDSLSFLVFNFFLSSAGSLLILSLAIISVLLLLIVANLTPSTIPHCSSASIAAMSFSSASKSLSFHCCNSGGIFQEQLPGICGIDSKCSLSLQATCGEVVE